ncbi:MAG: DNA-processing protein DprA [Panacagrimonas sp.]
MPPEELRAWLRLIRAPGLGARPILDLVAAFGSAAAALDAGAAAWQRLGVDPKAWDGQLGVDAAQLDSDAQWCAGERRGLLVHGDPRYPQRLREITHSPPALFYRGDIELLDLPQIAVVGSRNASPQGLETAEGFAGELARRGLVVTSGLALGIDGAAHRGALNAGGHTIAVCATGLDRVYPARHRELAAQIDAAGLLISEFAPGTSPRPEHFPRRNRLISGLALGVLVVEAARESGSLITARLAAEQGREVFAIPGSIHNVMARGCHQLIRQGAKLVETVDDILEEIGNQVGHWLKADAESRPQASAALHRHHAVLDALGDEPQAVDRLVEKLGMSVEVLSGALLELELEGLLATAPGGRVMRLGQAARKSPP